MKNDNAKIIYGKEEREKFLKENNIKIESYPSTMEEMIDRFYDDDCHAKLYYMGMYSVKDSGRVIWQTYSRKSYVEGYLAQTENTELQQIFSLFGQPDVMKVLRILIDSSFEDSSLSVCIDKIADNCGIEQDRFFSILQDLKDYNLIEEKDGTDGKVYSVRMQTIEGFVLLLAGGCAFYPKKRK